MCDCVFYYNRIDAYSSSFLDKLLMLVASIGDLSRGISTRFTLLSSDHMLPSLPNKDELLNLRSFFIFLIVNNKQLWIASQ